MPSTSTDHDRVVRFVAANRFPFPGQTDWPAGYTTIANFGSHVIDTPDGPISPDIVILDERGEPCRLGEVETGIDAAAVARWATCSAVADTLNETGVKNLFVYVPKGLAADALRELDGNGISFAGLREWEVDGETVRVTPFLTRGDRYDHQ